MSYPVFFDNISPLQMFDPLAQLLGAVDDGMINYTYLDMVKLAGHSCPTVAGAWIITDLGLKKLHGDNLPTRGNIKIEMAGALDEGVEGVIAQCIGLVTGAANEGGFKGIGAKYSRNNRLIFDSNINGEVRLTRLDNGQSVTMKYDPSAIPFHPQMGPLMQKIGQDTMTATEKAFFAEEWQNRVKKILNLPDRWEQLVTFV
ncbi:MAG: hypothetical protein KAG12_04520 [Desulfuromusa sp.]|nr:hypothetical protein [Desulfuromusa sp.]